MGMVFGSDVGDSGSVVMDWVLENGNSVSSNVTCLLV